MQAFGAAVQSIQSEMRLAIAAVYRFGEPFSVVRNLHEQLCPLPMQRDFHARRFGVW